MEEGSREGGPRPAIREAARMSVRGWIVRAAGRTAWLVAALCALQSAIAVNGIAFALLMRQAVDAAVTGLPEAFQGAAAAFAGLVLLQVVLRAANRFVLEQARALLDNRLRRRAFAGALEQEYRVASSFHTGALMSRMTSDVAVVTEGATSFVPNLVSMGIRVVGALAAMYVLVPTLALVFLAAGCAAALLSVLLRGWLKRLHRGMQEAESDVRCFLQECLESLLVVRAFGCERKVERASERAMDEHARARMRKANASNLCNTGLTLAMQAGYVLGFAWCGWGILQGTVSYGTLMAVVQLVGQIQSPFASLGGTFSRYSSMLASAERLMELDGAGGGGRRGASLADADARGLYARMEVLRFDDVTFGYGRDLVLEGFSLVVPKGSFVAVTGPSGQGKSTLVNLACRFFEPTSGQILIDGRDYRERSQLWLHSNIGYVLQNPHLFSGTIRENIRYGRLDATDAEVEAAARTVSADQVAAKLEKGWDSDVGEGGDRLSTGEKQLISFARAVLADPRIFVLDEATSSIDTQTEQLIQNAIDHLLRDRTSFLIAHRLSTIRKADLILVVRDGRIVEQGRHLELLQKGGYYHDLYTRQFAEESAARILK